MGWSENLVTWCTIFTIVMLIAAITDHHWIFIQTSTQNYYSGLWKVCAKQVCTSLIATSPNIQSARTLLIFALFCSFIGFSFMVFTYRYFSRYTAYRYLVAAMGAFITGSLVFLAMSTYTIRIASQGNNRTARITYQWAFYIAWSSCPLFILSGLFGLMAHSRSPVQRLSLTDSESTTLSSTSGFLSSSSSYMDEDGKKSVGGENDDRSGVQKLR